MTAGTTVAIAGSTAATGARSAFLDLPGFADATEGTAKAAITATSATIPELRFPDFVFAIPPLPSGAQSALPPPQNNCAHSVTRIQAMRPPSGGGTDVIHPFEGWVARWA
jgi:hypothetical protein